MKTLYSILLCIPLMLAVIDKWEADIWAKYPTAVEPVTLPEHVIVVIFNDTI